MSFFLNGSKYNIVCGLFCCNSFKHLLQEIMDSFEYAAPGRTP